MTIWLVGGDGNLGTCVAARLRALGIADVVATDLEIDVADTDTVRRYAERGFSHIVNCAAFTNVDGAESDADGAAKANHHAVANLASAAVATGAALVHVSTDYVFDGRGARPYLESDPCAPISAYGRSKRAGEEALVDAIGDFAACPANAYIVRTSWLFGPRGKDFVGTMRRLLSEREEIGVVDDQHGRPTYAPDLAEALLRLSGIEGGQPAASGIYHFANADPTTWYELTCAIRDQLAASCRVIPIGTDQYPLPAPRPAYSVLSTDKLTTATGMRPRPWREALADCLSKTPISHG